MGPRAWRHFDFWLISATSALVGLGLAMIYSATYGLDQQATIDPIVIRQLTYAVVGFVLLLLCVGFDYRLLSNLAGLIWAGAVGLLVVVLVLGRLQFGAQRWIEFGVIQFQPSEPAKLAVAIALARYFSTHRERIHRPRTVLTSLAIAGIPAGLVLIQPDLGSALVFAAIWFGVSFVAGVRWLHFGALVGTAALAAPAAWSLAPAYMKARLQIFLDPSADALGEGYNIIQATISVGSGGLLGRGFLSGTQSQLQFLRVQYADFIFSVLAEELGFVGAMALFALFGILLFRAFRAALLASEPFGRLLVVGIASMVAFQMFVNVAMNVQVLPVTGIPLPLISYGGSSLITVMAAIGIIQSVTMRHRKLEF